MSETAIASMPSSLYSAATRRTPSSSTGSISSPRWSIRPPTSRTSSSGTTRGGLIQ
jgi:hypothetical protein